jgi:CheY-like chemotaxis protein
MWVESEPGVGSTFFFSLPVVLEMPASEAKRTPHELQRREVGTLVVVERHAVLSRLVARQVEGIRVESVQSVAELRGEDAPEVVIINEPLTELSALLPLPEAFSCIPVFRCYVHGALTLPASDSESAASMNHQYLIKPVKRELLYVAVSQMLAARVRVPARPAGRPARILVVEDEEDASYLLSRMLYLASPDVLQGFEGVAVLKARSVDVAIQYLNELRDPAAQPIDAVLLDLVLGNNSGYAVLAEMDKQTWLHDLPVCVITGQVAGGDLLVTPYVAFTRKSGLSARELAQAIVALTRIALPGVDVTMR